MTFRRFILATALTASAVIACSSNTEGPTGEEVEESDAGKGADGDPPNTGTDVKLQFQPKQGFTGFDGTHTFTFPIAIYGAKSTPTLTASDPSMVEIVRAKLRTNDPDFPDDGAYFLVTAKKAGNLELLGTSEGVTVKAQTTIVNYDAARYAAGQARYINGTGNATDSNKPCTECHNATSSADHSPAALAGIADTDVENTIRSGRRATGGTIMTGTGEDHIWNASAAEANGLITYLRALPQAHVILDP